MALGTSAQGAANDRNAHAAVSRPRRHAAAVWSVLLRAAPDVAASLMVLTAAVLVMGPVLLQLNSRLYGIGGDGVGAPAGIAEFRSALDRGGLLGPLPPLFGAPFFYPDPGAAADPLWWHAGALLTYVVSAVGSANLLVFAGFVLTGL